MFTPQFKLSDWLSSIKFYYTLYLTASTSAFTMNWLSEVSTYHTSANWTRNVLGGFKCCH